MPQRLAICFDGTWNSRDSGTNVCHLSDLIREGDVGSGWTQRVYYDPGVGTGILDSLTGGVFGSGLSHNVMEAYDWLIDCFEDGDEIYVFGFSRGAFTARSLVGFISKCGVLKRGAPISLDELWKGYQIIGRYPPGRLGANARPTPNWFEVVFGLPQRPFRELGQLKQEDWEKKWRAASGAGPADLVQDVDRNRTERLLVEFSRRPQITCVGVFDTVGALGIDALALPGIVTRIASFHDVGLSSVVVNAFQALAIDEHRASFAHVPWYQEVRPYITPGRTVCGGEVEQRWFVGAHSNVGGGYEDDVLAQWPLRWMMAKCNRLGLGFRQTPPAPQTSAVVPLLEPAPATSTPNGKIAGKGPNLRDSYAEFGGLFWQYVIRAKRDYRRIAPPVQIRYGVPMCSANETVDDSVPEILKKNNAGSRPYLPPNLWEYDQRIKGGRLAVPTPSHAYCRSVRDVVMLVVWLALAGLGAWVIAGAVPDAPGAILIGAVVTAILAIADFTESALNHRVTVSPDGFFSAVCLDLLNALVFVRIVGILLVPAGIVALGTLITAGWPRIISMPDDLVSFAALWLLIFLIALFGAAMTWAAWPVTEAGMKSPTKLQGMNPADVLRQLTAWTGGQRDRSLLAPVVRSLWLDAALFVPAYAALLYSGMTIFWSLWQGAPPAWHWEWKTLAFGLTVSTVAADLVEDALHLSYFRAYDRLFPASGAAKAPPAFVVQAARVATGVKFVLFATGMAFTVASLGWILWRQFVHGLSGLEALSSAVAVFVLFAVTRQFISRLRTDGS